MEAVPVEPKVIVEDPSVPTLVESVAVLPIAEAKGLEQGLLVSAQAVTVTVVGRQLRLDVGNEIS